MKKPTKLIRKSSDLQYGNLETIQARTKRTPRRPSSLPLKDLHVADKVFQWRLADEDLVADRDHVWELVRVISSSGKALDAILVTPIGSKFYVVDGHHRLDAYHTAKWKKRVPVELFLGDLKEAYLEALKRNRKNKLQMTTRAKSEAAWKLVLEGGQERGGPSWSQITELTTVQRRTVANMARAFRLHKERIENENLSWQEVRRLEWPKNQSDVDDDWQSKKARKLADQLVKVRNLTKETDVTARALEMVSELLPQRLVSEWPDAAYEVTIEHLRENAPELAEQVFGVLFTDALRL